MEEKEKPNCQICGCDIDDKDVVYCTACFTPHHRDCWEYNSRCSTFACGGKVSATSPTPLDKAGNLVPAPQTDIPEVGTPTNFAQRVTRLDLDTPLETGLAILFFLSLLAALFLPVFLGGAGAAFFAFLSVVVGIVMGSTDCTYVLDNEKRSIDFVRHFLGKTTRYTVCTFEDIRAVAMRSAKRSGKHNTWWEYATTIVLDDGAMVQVINYSKDDAAIDMHARTLAAHMGVPFHEGEPEHVLALSRNEKNEITLVNEPYSVLDHEVMPWVEYSLPLVIGLLLSILIGVILTL